MPPIAINLTLALLLSFATLGTAPSPSFAAQCRFVLGFQTIQDLIPDIVGDCLVDEHYSENGDALQETNRGLLVWRKADNFTAFTDGHNTWVNGPFGLQQRLNSERFPWERDQVVAGATSGGAEIVAYLDWTLDNQLSLEDHLGEVSLLLQELRDSDCTCGADPEWQAAMVEAHRQLKSIALGMQSYPAGPIPEQAAPLHALSIAVGQGLATYADEVISAVNADGVDMARLTTAVGHLLQAAERAEQWYDVFGKLDAKYV